MRAARASAVDGGSSRKPGPQSGSAAPAGSARRRALQGGEVGAQPGLGRGRARRTGACPCAPDGRCARRLAASIGLRSEGNGGRPSPVLPWQPAHWLANPLDSAPSRGGAGGRAQDAVGVGRGRARPPGGAGIDHRRARCQVPPLDRRHGGVRRGRGSGIAPWRSVPGSGRRLCHRPGRRRRPTAPGRCHAAAGAVRWASMGKRGRRCDSPFEVHCAPILPGRNRRRRSSTGSQWRRCSTSLRPDPRRSAVGRFRHRAARRLPRRKARWSTSTASAGYEIAGVDAMPPFLMTVASDSDHWMFVSSTGGLTAGRRIARPGAVPVHHRRSPARQRRAHRSADHPARRRRRRAGCSCGSRCRRAHAGLYRTSRAPGQEPARQPAALRRDEPRSGARASPTSGSPATASGSCGRRPCATRGGAPVAVDLLDGLLNLMPAGLGRRFQQEFSTLGDGYKDSEVDPAHRAGHLPAVLHPRRRGRAQRGPAGDHRLVAPACRTPRYLLSTRAAGPVSPLADRSRPSPACAGQRGAYLVSARLTLAPGGGRRLLPGGRRRAGRRRGGRHRPAAGRRRSRWPPWSGGRCPVAAAGWSRWWPPPTACRSAATSCTPPATSPTCCSTASAAASRRAATPSIARTSPGSWQSTNRRVHGRQQAFLARLPERMPRGQLVCARPASSAIPIWSAWPRSTCR